MLNKKHSFKILLNYLKSMGSCLIQNGSSGSHLGSLSFVWSRIHHASLLEWLCKSSRATFYVAVQIIIQGTPGLTSTAVSCRSYYRLSQVLLLPSYVTILIFRYEKFHNKILTLSTHDHFNWISCQNLNHAFSFLFKT